MTEGQNPATGGPPSKPPIVVSACLAGVRCRHDGGSKPDPRIVELVRQGRALLVCPEQLGGLPTPRPPANIVPGKRTRVLTEGGDDVTEQFERGAAEAVRLARLAGVQEAILKERSPSCGTRQVWQQSPGEDPRLGPGEGITAARLRNAGVRLDSEETWSPLEADETPSPG